MQDVETTVWQFDKGEGDTETTETARNIGTESGVIRYLMSIKQTKF